MTAYCPECRTPITLSDDRCPMCGFDPFQSLSEYDDTSDEGFDEDEFDVMDNA